MRVILNLKQNDEFFIKLQAIWDASTFDKLYRLDHLTELRLKCIGINANGELKPCKSIKKLVLDIDSVSLRLIHFVN